MPMQSTASEKLLQSKIICEEKIMQNLDNV